MEQCTVYSSELESLQKLLHFPEEVAIKLTQTEHALFCKVIFIIVQTTASYLAQLFETANSCTFLTKMRNLAKGQKLTVLGLCQ